MQLQDIANITKGVLIGDSRAVRSISIDTRTLQPGDVYLAIRGETLDGHQFIPQAIAAGAVGVIVDRAVDEAIAQIHVEHTGRALQHLAAHHRQRMNVKAVAVTGSCGKTTTRAFLERMFSEVGSTHASPGSFNNHIGVPLTLLTLEPTHQFLVSEVGANHLGEIAELIPLIQPDVAVITNIAPVHIEGFGSLDNIARAKAEIYGGLSAQGTAIVNADDHYADFLKTANRDCQHITFGIQHTATVMAQEITLDEKGCASFTLVLPNQSDTIQLRVLGEHHVYNALAAAAAGYALGLSLSQIRKGLELAEAVYCRLVEHTLMMGATLIDDSYNANPLATKAALKILANRPGERLFAFADMKELGQDATALHADIGLAAKSLGIHKLFCYGELARETAKAFGKGASHFDHKQDLIQALQSQLQPHQVILVKGSNSMGMNKVVSALLDTQDSGISI